MWDRPLKYLKIDDILCFIIGMFIVAMVIVALLAMLIWTSHVETMELIKTGQYERDEYSFSFGISRDSTKIDSTKQEEKDADLYRF